MTPSRIEVTGPAQVAAWAARSLPPVEEVRAGVWSIPIPIPRNALRYTLCYAIEQGGRLVVVDPGWPTETGWSALTAGLAALGARTEDVVGVVVTHVHLDHHGLTTRLREACGAWVAMHSVEWNRLPTPTELGSASPREAAWLSQCGVPADERTALTLGADMIDHIAALARPDVLLAHGDHLPGDDRRLRVVWTPGHTPGHICLHDTVEDLVLTGDHLLPRITPHVGLNPYTTEPPLASYLRALGAMRDFASAEALPAHEYRFRGIPDRVEELLAHHEHRTQEILDVLAPNQPMTVWDVAERISWSRTWTEVTGAMRRAALAETAAHLQHLADEGSVLRRGEAPWRWRLAPTSLG